MRGTVPACRVPVRWTRSHTVLPMACCALLLAAGPARAHGEDAHPTPAPSEASVTTEPAPLEPPLFEPPPPGSYELPPIDAVREHALLDEQGLSARLPGLGKGQAAVVSFVYGSCPSGCPLALATLQRLDRELAARPELAGHVSLVTVSFDPERDAPARMAELREHLAPRTPWRFLTAPDEASLAPVLDDYGQRVMRRVDPEDSAAGLLDHVLKVFLVDDRLRIRNVYSVGLMDPRLILNDLRTVLAD